MQSKRPFHPVIVEERLEALWLVAAEIETKIGLDTFIPSFDYLTDTDFGLEDLAARIMGCDHPPPEIGSNRG